MKYIHIICLGIFLIGCTDDDHYHVDYENVSFSMYIDGACHSKPIKFSLETHESVESEGVVTGFIDWRLALQEGDIEAYVESWHSKDKSSVSDVYKKSPEHFDRAKAYSLKYEKGFLLYCVTEFLHQKYMFYSLLGDEYNTIKYQIFEKESGTYKPVRGLPSPDHRLYSDTRKFENDMHVFNRQIFYIQLVVNYIRLKHYNLFGSNRSWLMDASYVPPDQ